MTAVLLATRLKVADPVALTALATLRDRLGLGDRLAGLSREELFLFEIEAPPAEAAAMVTHLARHTNLFMNPNKHVFRVTAAAGTGPGEPGAGSGASNEMNRQAWLMVWSPGDGEELVESLWRHTGATRVTAVRHAWLWCFTAREGTGRERFLAAVEAAAVVRSRRRGLLVHPAYQDSRLYEAPPSVYDTRSTIGWTPATAVPPEGLSGAATLHDRD